MKLKIRKANKKDLEEVVNIFMKEYKKPPYNENWTRERAVKRVKNYFEGKVYVADAEKEIAGFIILETFTWDTEDRGVIAELVVSSKYQRQGIGKKLIETAEEFFRKKEIETIILSANKKAKALNFYHKLNYKDTNYVELAKRLK